MIDAEVPNQTRVRLTHAVMQILADRAGVDILHVKGPAVAPELWRRVPSDSGEERVERRSSDADVLVRPSHLDRFLEALAPKGWETKSSFVSGSAFEHALNVYHRKLGSCDIHRHFPGMDIPHEAAFEKLWADRTTMILGNTDCSVPSVTGQRLVLLLHAARSGGAAHPDVDPCWHRATPEEQAAVLDLAEACNARVPLAAALGTLDEHADDRRYRLWKHFSSPDRTSRLDEWRGRFEAARGVRGKLHVMVRFMLLNKDVVAIELGHEPSRRELLQAQRERIATMAGDIAHAVARRTRRQR